MALGRGLKGDICPQLAMSTATQVLAPASFADHYVPARWEGEFLALGDRSYVFRAWKAAVPWPQVFCFGSYQLAGAGLQGPQRIGKSPQTSIDISQVQSSPWNKYMIARLFQYSSQTYWFMSLNWQEKCSEREMDMPSSSKEGRLRVWSQTGLRA